jgi:alkylation response protein AidB-like acyl-CoA dehydrogenase
VDFALTDDQAAMVASVDTLLERHAGPGRARELLREGRYDAALMAALAEAGFLDLADEGAGPLEAVLVTEAVARAAGCAPVGARALVAPAVLAAPLPGVVALAPDGAEALTRYAEAADVVLTAGGRAVPADAVRATAVPSMFGYPLARVEADDGAGDAIDGERLLAWWRIALAAEMVGTMETALGMTVEHVTDRRQFGRPLGANQALQHRLAELHHRLEGARWLTRYAAATGAVAEDAAAAAAQAAATAELLTRETHQLSGAMGLTEEYDLFLWTMRLPALRLELGGVAAHAAAVARARWGAPA